MSRRFNVKNIIGWSVSVKGLTAEQRDKLMMFASEIGGAVVIRPEVAKNEQRSRIASHT